MIGPDGSVHLDAMGLTCPLPVLRLQKALRGLPRGTQITLNATDPMTEIDVPHFLHESGHQLIAAKRIADAGPQGLPVFEFIISSAG